MLASCSWCCPHETRSQMLVLFKIFYMIAISHFFTHFLRQFFCFCLSYSVSNSCICTICINHDFSSHCIAIAPLLVARTLAWKNFAPNWHVSDPVGFSAPMHLLVFIVDVAIMPVYTVKYCSWRFLPVMCSCTGTCMYCTWRSFRYTIDNIVRAVDMQCL